MGIANYVFDKIADSAGTVAGGVAAVAVGAGVGYAAKAVVDDKKFQEKAADIYKLGIKKGVQLGSTKARTTFVDPLVAKVAVAQFIALSDGKVSRSERKKIDAIIKGVSANPQFPRAAIKEIEKLSAAENLNFNDIQKYLDIVNVDALSTFADDIYSIARANNGISYRERAAIDEFENYLLERGKALTKKAFTRKVAIEQNKREDSVEEFFADFVHQEDVQEAVEEFSVRMRLLDMAFKRKTRLNEKEIALLMSAVGLQCVRIFLIDQVTEIEKANHGKKENFLHQQQAKLLGALNKGDDDKARPYYAPLNEIISTKGVPYDATVYAGEKLDLFKGVNGAKGVNHRFATLGHDPLIGLVVGTTNILTNTITTTQSTSLVPVTNHVVYDDRFKNPKIAGQAKLAVAMSKVAERSKEDATPLVAALIKQLIHIATDTYTPAGIQLPGANLILERQVVEQLTQYVSTGDVVKIGTSEVLADFIDKLIEILHACMLLEENARLDEALNKVKTKKIVLYSHAIATSSSVIGEYVLGKYQDIDFGGLISLLKRVFSDIDFIYDVKFEFLKSGLSEALFFD